MDTAAQQARGCSLAWLGITIQIRRTPRRLEADGAALVRIAVRQTLARELERERAAAHAPWMRRG